MNSKQQKPGMSLEWKVALWTAVVIICLLSANQYRKFRMEKARQRLAFMTKNPAQKNPLEMTGKTQQQIEAERKARALMRTKAKADMLAIQKKMMAHIQYESQKVYSDAEVNSEIKKVTQRKDLPPEEKRRILMDLQNRLYMSRTPASKKQPLLKLVEQKAAYYDRD
jgi:hypothetical protein